MITRNTFIRIINRYRIDSNRIIVKSAKICTYYVQYFPPISRNTYNLFKRRISGKNSFNAQVIAIASNDNTCPRMFNEKVLECVGKMFNQFGFLLSVRWRIEGTADNFCDLPSDDFGLNETPYNFKVMRIRNTKF